MAKYKIKKSYLELKDTENYTAFHSPMKHRWLSEGKEVDITSVPEKLKEHLEEVGIKKTKKEK